MIKNLKLRGGIHNQVHGKFLDHRFTEAELEQMTHEIMEVVQRYSHGQAAWFEIVYDKHVGGKINS